MDTLLFHSTNEQSPPVNLRDALLIGQAPDKGLYLPRAFPKLSPTEIAEFQRFYQPTLSAGRKVYTGRSGLVAAIRSFPPNEAEEAAEYRAGCLMLSPKERINRMRALSRRLILLNPDNPRSPHIDFRHIRITHDAI